MVEEELEDLLLPRLATKHLPEALLWLWTAASAMPLEVLSDMPQFEMHGLQRRQDVSS